LELLKIFEDYFVPIYTIHLFCRIYIWLYILTLVPLGISRRPGHIRNERRYLVVISFIDGQVMRQVTLISGRGVTSQNDGKVLILYQNFGHVAC
jgi:hypothetical protein